MTRRCEMGRCHAVPGVDDQLPPYREVHYGTVADCCGCVVELAPPPDPLVCGCWCHDVSRAFHRRGPVKP